MSLASCHLQQETVPAVEAAMWQSPHGGHLLGMNPNQERIVDVAGDLLIGGVTESFQGTTDDFGVRHVQVPPGTIHRPGTIRGCTSEGVEK